MEDPYEARLVFGEYHVEESWPDKTDDGIARLILGGVVLVNKLDRMRVVEYIHRHREPNAVLPQVFLGLGLIPFKSHTASLYAYMQSMA